MADRSAVMTASGTGVVRGNNLDNLRQHNLSTLLTLLHSHGAMSRSALTRVTGLNRSTIAALVLQLSERGLVIESEPTLSGTVGRPSPVVRPDPHLVALAVTPEIDGITVAAVGLHGRVQQRRWQPLEPSTGPAQTMRIAAALIDDLRMTRTLRITGIGVAVPGLVRTGTGTVISAPSLGWGEEPIAEMLAEATGLRVWAGNDASLGVQAERILGAARGMDFVVYLNGTAGGIGGGVVMNGVPVTGVGGFAGEFGQAAVPANRSGHEVRAVVNEHLSKQRLMKALGIDDPDAFDTAVRQTESAEFATEVDHQIDVLAGMLANTVNVLNPQLVVLGGFLSTLYEIRGPMLQSLVEERTLPAAFAQVKIVRAALGADLLLIGAAELAFAGLLADPAGFQF